MTANTLIKRRNALSSALRSCRNNGRRSWHRFSRHWLPRASGRAQLRAVADAGASPRERVLAVINLALLVFIEWAGLSPWSGADLLELFAIDAPLLAAAWLLPVGVVFDLVEFTPACDADRASSARRIDRSSVLSKHDLAPGGHPSTRRPRGLH